VSFKREEDKMYNVKYLEGVIVMVFNATFNNIAIYSAGQFCWWGKPEYPGENQRQIFIT